MEQKQVNQMADEPMEDELDVLIEMAALIEQGKEEEAFKLQKKVTLPHYMGQYAKDFLEPDWLKNCGWNLSEVEAVYGKDFINK